MSAYLDRLLEVNTSRVAGDLQDRLLDTRRALEQEVRARLTALVTSTTQAITRAYEHRASGEAAVRDELDRLRRLYDRVSRISASRPDPHAEWPH